MVSLFCHFDGGLRINTARQRGTFSTTNQINGQVLHMKTGDPIVEVVNTWHYGINEGNETAEILVFYAGTKDESVTIKRTGNK